MFTQPKSFVSDTLPALIAGVGGMHLLLATYNSVSGYESGDVETGVEGLTIHVQNGNLHYSPMTDLVFYGGELGRIGAEAMDAEGQAAQASLESNVKIENDEGTLLFSIVYAGVSAFDEAVDFARKIKKDHPTAKIVVLTCDCGLNSKKRDLLPMLQDKVFEEVIVTNRCGGEDIMSYLLESIKDAWASKVSV